VTANHNRSKVTGCDSAKAGGEKTNCLPKMPYPTQATKLT